MSDALAPFCRRQAKPLVVPCFTCMEPMRPTRWQIGVVVVEGHRCKACGVNLISKDQQKKLVDVSPAPAVEPLNPKVSEE